MRISDWSSDVCSSDLVKRDAIALLHPARFERIGKAADLAVELAVGQLAACLRGIVGLPDDRNIVAALRQIDRKSVVSGKRVSVRVDLGGRRIIKKKKETQRHSSINTKNKYSIH